MIESTPFPEAALDRQCEQRSEPGFMEKVLASDSHRVMVFHRGRALMAGSAPAFLKSEALPETPPEGTTVVYLGQVAPGQEHPLPQGTHLVLHALPDDAGALGWVPEGSAFARFRDVAGNLNTVDEQAFVQAQAVANWHASHRHCPRCGTRTINDTAGWMRRCPQDGSQHFPRTDPAVIVAIVGSDGRILLANNKKWEANRYSTVAGFVEGGESAEQAAAREIAEEVGVALHSLRYISSQAWPFPQSLMLGFLGYTDDTVAVPDNVEVRGARWFDRDELQAAVLGGEAQISHRFSIARTLIEHWYGGPIAEPGDQA